MAISNYLYLILFVSLASSFSSFAQAQLDVGSGNSFTPGYSPPPAAGAIGENNKITGRNAFCVGSYNEVGDHSYAFGIGNKVSGYGSLAVGLESEAYGSFAYGDFAKALHCCSVVLCDGSGGITTTNTSQFACRFTGTTGFPLFGPAYKFITSLPGDPETGVAMFRNSNSWVTYSDVNRKEHFEETDGNRVLNEFTKIKLGSWNYKGSDPKTERHYGIMAQDFYNAFGKDSYGTIGCDTLVNPIDMMGIAYSAIRELNVKRKALEAENNLLKVKLESIELRLNLLELHR
jgi:hypothetical protein